jgi:hypothetical protein
MSLISLCTLRHSFGWFFFLSFFSSFYLFWLIDTGSGSAMTELWAGAYSQSGTTDAASSLDARFNSPSACTSDSVGNRLFISDTVSYFHLFMRSCPLLSYLLLVLAPTHLLVTLSITTYRVIN